MPLVLNLSEKLARLVVTPRAHIKYSKNFKRGTCTVIPITTLDMLSDDILSKVLGHVFDEENQCQIRLINKRFAVLALPFTLHTVSLSSSTALQNLVSAPYGPLVNENIARHIKCIELCFVPQNIQLVTKGTFPITCPNLAVVRFRFKLGIPLKSGRRLEEVLFGDTLSRAARISSNTSWLAFLSSFSPTRFEWISTDTKDLRLVGLYNDLRHTFKSWKSLSSIYLDGICLIEQQNIYSWSIALPTDYVHVRGPFHGPEILHFYHPERIRDSKNCRMLVLESHTHAGGEKAQLVSVAALSYGNTMVTLKGWTYFHRKVFVAGLTGKALPLHLQFFASSHAFNIPNNWLNWFLVTSVMIFFLSICVSAGQRRQITDIMQLVHYDHLIPTPRPGWRRLQSHSWFSSGRAAQGSQPAEKYSAVAADQAGHSKTEEPYRFVTYYHVPKDDRWVITSHFTTQYATQSSNPSNTQPIGSSQTIAL